MLSLLRVILCFILGLTAAMAQDSEYFMPTDSTQVNWLFSGLLSTESGDQLAYFFQVEREGNQYHSIAALFDVQTQRMIFQDESRADLRQTDSYHWTVGNAMLQFNPINSSWVFGVTNQDKQGFNFKMDMLAVAEPVVKEDLRPGLTVLVSQTHALNGHIRLGRSTDEQFVMAKRAWFRQTWVSSNQFSRHRVDSLLCHLPDGSSLYALRLPEEDASKGAMAGLLTAEGTSTPISQFIEVQQLAGGRWDIRVPTSALHLVLSEQIQYHGLIAGFSPDKAEHAFCLLGQDRLGSHLGESRTL